MSKLSLDAKQVIAEINAVIAKINEIKNSSIRMNKATKANFAGMEASIKNLKNNVGVLGNRINYLKGALKGSQNALKQFKNNTKQNTKVIKENSNAVNKNAKGYNNLSLSIGKLLKAGGLFQLLVLFKQLLVNTYENIKTFDSLSFTLEKITKTTLDYENSQRFLLRITKAYGVELVTTTVRWSRFLAAANESGLALKDTEDIFESMTKASATLGLKTDELTSVYLALEQMLSKGKVTTEELRRQLGERLPGAMGIMAASMGVTIPKLDQMLKKGQVLSAEVLPNFAKAVERAYGIENADRIDTLVSKQNRLTASWQTFIKNISEGDGVIKKVLGGFLELLNETIEGWDRIFANDKQNLRLRISVEEGNFEKDIKKSFQNLVDRTSETANQDIALDSRKRTLEERLKTATGDEIKIIKNGLDEILKIKIEKDQQADDLLKEKAKERLDESYKNFVNAQRRLDEINLDFQNVKSGKQVSSEFNQEDLNKARTALVLATVEYNVFRKLVADSDVQILNNDEPGKTQKKLRAVKDFYLETANSIAKITLNQNKEISKNEKINLKERLEAIKKSAEFEVFIRKNKLAIEKRDANNKFDIEVKSLENAVNDGRLTREKASKQTKKLEDEKNQYIKLKSNELVNDLLKINNRYADKSKQVAINGISDTREGVAEDFFNKQLLAARKVFDESAKTAQDRDKLERDSARIAIQAANSVIDIKIRLLEEEKRILSESGEANSEYIEKLQREINKLNAAKTIEPPVDTADWTKVFEESLDIIRDFSNGIGDLIDAAFERRLEYINAEINAEEEKYDKLISLAEGDDQQQATLERNKEDRLKKLDQERLKQEQKQAKARKKFALADIAISTARAIIGIWADFPKGDYGIAAGIMSGVVAALGAVQAAAVIAQPIPQYKDGVNNLSKNERAMINDGGFKEYIERNGKILSINKPNAIVDLKKGDTVYKNKSDMIKKSDLFRIKNINAINQVKNKPHVYNLEESITKGFKKVKISNNINLPAQSNNYKQLISRWN